MGDGWLASPGLTPAQARQSLERYLGYCAKHNRQPGVTAIRRDIYVGENGAEAEVTGGKLVAAGYRGFSPEATIVGDAETVAKAFEDLAGLGFTDIIIRNLVPDQDKALASTARLAEVKSWLG